MQGDTLKSGNFVDRAADAAIRIGGTIWAKMYNMRLSRGRAAQDGS